MQCHATLGSCFPQSTQILSLIAVCSGSRPKLQRKASLQQDQMFAALLFIVVVLLKQGQEGTLHVIQVDKS